MRKLTILIRALLVTVALALSIVPESSSVGAEVESRTHSHWSFQPVRRPAVPSVKDSGWPINAIDAFVLAKLETKGWKPNAQATPGALLRRVYLDLTGLPPTPEEQERFLRDASREAYEAVVADLLGRTGYGERYARHWLDVVRYADSNGYERDAAKPEVWRYRDYVIRAINSDKPFDRFIIEQLAGDELADADTETVIATGFNRLGPWDDEPAGFESDRYDQLDDIVSTTSEAFLAITMGCARCHDHKFDPITTRDYYSMVAVFNTLTRPQSGRTELTRPAARPAMIRALEARDRRIAELRTKAGRVREAARVRHLAGGASKLPVNVIGALRLDDKDRSNEQKTLVRDNQAKLDAEVTSALTDDERKDLANIEAQIEALRRETPDPPPGYFMFEPSPTAPVTHILLRGNPRSPGDEVGPAAPAALVTMQPTVLKPDEFTSRRRLSLARWIASADNPLTARVIVNRVWQWHFGEGLVRTPNDFGRMGDTPSHPELLDHLADWFVRDAHWSLKKLHTLILSSRTYQMSRASRDDCAAVDPENRLLWRQSYRRLEVEAIRDSMLAASGRLDRTMFGPPVYPYIPKEALLSHADKTSMWPAFDEATASRRTIYAFTKRSLMVPMLEVLDFCDTTRTAPKRSVATVPTQALTLFNGEFINRQARHLADRLRKEAGPNAKKQIELAMRLVVCRAPTDEERTSMLRFLDDEATHLGDDAAKRNEIIALDELNRQALIQLCRVLFNLDEFMYTD